MQVVWVRSKGRYDLSFNYTWSKSLGIVGSNQLDLSQDYGAQPFDRRHLFNAAYSVELPNPVHDNKVLAGVVNGWQISGINTVQSGVNLTGGSLNGNFNTTGNISNNLTVQNAFNSSVTNQSITGTDFIPLGPILTCDPRKNVPSGYYLNGNCFSVPTVPGKNGSIVLPEFFGPWAWTWDLSLFKNFQIKERNKLQFRFSAYNWLNHPEWSFTRNGTEANNLYLHFAPAAGGGQVQTNADFGKPPIKLGNRIIQLALKYTF